jgi:hypothetical protein
VSLCAQKNFVRGKNLLSEAAACELQDCQAGASAGEASSKISARAETLRTTSHQLQSKLGKTEPKPSFEGGRLNRIGKPQNGQCGAERRRPCAEP